MAQNEVMQKVKGTN